MISIKIGSRSNRLPYRDESNIPRQRTKPPERHSLTFSFSCQFFFSTFRKSNSFCTTALGAARASWKKYREDGQSNKYHTTLGVAKPTKSGSILRSCNRQVYMCNLHTVYSGFFGRISDMPHQKFEAWFGYWHIIRCVHRGGTRVGNKAKSRPVLSKFYTDNYRRDVLYMPTENKHSIAKRVRGRKRGKNVTRNPILESTIPPIHPYTLNPLTCLLCLNRLSINSTAATEYRLFAPNFPSSTLAIGDTGVIS
jgi:hypothetical protein